MDLTKQFFKYVSQNIFGLLGTSCYILADTYFIAQAAGTDGVTLLNLCLPIYNFIFAIGSMIALGSATRYAIAKAQNDARGQRYFSNAILCAVLASIPWMLAGAFVPGALLVVGHTHQRHHAAQDHAQRQRQCGDQQGGAHTVDVLHPAVLQQKGLIKLKKEILSKA